ncbi:MAG: ABC transporter permease subunit [Roseovarius sp.]
MLDLIAPFFERLNETTGLNFSPFYDSYDWGRLVEGMTVSVKLIAAIIALSLVIGVVGAGAQTSRLKLVRGLVAAYIEVFRNTPPIVQLLFFYFGLGAITPQVDMGGWYEPMIGSFGWAVIAIGILVAATTSKSSARASRRCRTRRKRPRNRWASRGSRSSFM